MAKKREPRLTAAELTAELRRDSELVQKKRAAELERVARAARIHDEELPILIELKAVGWDLQSVWDLVRMTSPYQEAIPVLLKHLPLPYSDVVRDGIARALAVPVLEVQEALPILVDQYRKAPAGYGITAPGDVKEYPFGTKNGLACAVSAALTEKTLPLLISLLKDPSLGESRILLLPALKKRVRKVPEVKAVIKNLAGDPQLAKEIASWGDL